MSKKNKLKYEITADSTKFDKVMHKTVQTSKTVAKGVGVAVGAGAIAGTVALVGLKKAMDEAIELANIQEEAEATLGAVLESTGEAAGYNLDQMTAMAGAMQGVTTVGDEVTISGMAILSTFKQIRGEAFERTTMSALDMSTVLKTDLSSSMVMLGKAVNDPIKGISALSRAGVQFTEDQKEQIKVLQKSGDIMGAQNIVLKELESQFGGAAAAIRETYGGAVTSAENAWGDLEEQIGFTITKNERFVDLAHEAEQTFIEWTETIKENKEEIADFAEGTLDSITAVVEGIGSGILTLQKWNKSLEEIGNKRTILALREELGGLNEDLYRAENGFFGIGKKSTEEVVKLKSQVSSLMELITDLETGRDPLTGILGDVDTYNKKIDELKKNLATVPPKVEEHKDAVDETTESFEYLYDASATYYEGIADYIDDAADREQDAADERESIHEYLTDEINRLTLSETDYKQVQLDAQIASLEGFAKNDKSLQDQIAAYRKLKNDEILADAEDTTTSISDCWGDYQDLQDDIVDAGVDAWVAGEDLKVAVTKVAQDYLSDAGAEMAKQGLTDLISIIGEELGLWGALGAASSSTEGDTLTKKLGNAAGYLVGAAAAIAGGKALGNNLADGGWISSHGSGTINQGSGFKDDVFLGYTDGGDVANWGMGGEYVINKKSTAKHLPLIEAINHDTFADGGSVGDALSTTRDVNDSGFDVFIDKCITSKGNWKAGIVEGLKYYASVAASMYLGKKFAKYIFEDGGQVVDRGFSFGDLVEDIADPGGYFHEVEYDTIEDAMDYITLDGLAGEGSIDWGVLWDAFRDLPVVGDTVDRADKILYPFIRDMTTAGKTADWDSVKDMIKGCYEDLGDEAATWIALAGLDPLGTIGLYGTFEKGTDYVPQTGPYLLHQGESVNTALETQKKVDLTEELLNEIKELKDLIASALSISSDRTYQIGRVIKKWDRKGVTGVPA